MKNEETEERERERKRSGGTRKPGVEWVMNEVGADMGWEVAFGSSCGSRIEEFKCQRTVFIFIFY